MRHSRPLRLDPETVGVATEVATRQRDPADVSAPLQRTAHPGVYRRGGRFVAVYRRGGRQRKESAASFAEARALKLARDAEERAERGGPLLHEYVLAWVGAYNGSGHDTVNDVTRREYRRLLITFALRYFPAEMRLAELDREALQGFVSWLIAYRGERGRLSDRSIRNAVAPLRLCLLAAAEEELDRARDVQRPAAAAPAGWARLGLRTGALSDPDTTGKDVGGDSGGVATLLRPAGFHWATAIGGDCLALVRSRTGGARPSLGAPLNRQGRGGCAEVALWQTLRPGRSRAGASPGGTTRPSIRGGSPRFFQPQRRAAEPKQHPLPSPCASRQAGGSSPGRFPRLPSYLCVHAC